MTYQLAYTIVNAQLVALSVPIEIDGQPATAQTTRLVVEAVPQDQAGKTLSLVLPGTALDYFPEGSVLSISIDPAVPAQPSEV